MATITIPTMRERVAVAMRTGGKTAFAAVMAGALAASQLALPASALAYDNASFTVETRNNAQAVYLVYRLFSADMDQNAGDDADFPPRDKPPARWPGIATHMSWNDSAKAAILGFLDSHTGTGKAYPAWIEDTYGTTRGSAEYSYQHDVPQNAAEYIAEQIGASADDPGSAHVPTAKAERSFALELARALAAAGVAADSCPADADGKATFTGIEGYYLFITDDASVGADEAGTSPIWVPLGGATPSITEKTAIPTLDKQVREDSTAEYGKVADANAGQELSYRLTATMPENIGAFDSYYLKFADELPAGMELSGGDTSSVKVVLNYRHGRDSYSPDITDNSHVSIGLSDAGILVVAIDDLKAVYSSLDKDATVAVTYDAHLTSEAVIGAQGNLNSAVLSYSSNPATSVKGGGSWNSPDPGGTATTLEGGHKTRTCTWRILLEKLDKQTHAKLAGARFTVQVAKTEGSADAQSPGLYVQADGSLGGQAHEFVTAKDGTISVPRIDSGSYTIHETAAPAGYELQDADIALEISPALDQASGEVKSWSARVSGGEGQKATEDDIVTHLVDAGDDGAMAAALESGTISVQTSDDRKVLMPITGMEGTSAAALAAGGVLLASLAGLGRGRRKEPDGQADA